MSVSPKEFVARFRAENPGEQLTYEKILNATGRTDLKKVDLQGVDLKNANLRYANLQGSNLRGADLRNANLWGINLRYAGLQNADLRAANLEHADLEGANLWGANLSNANLLAASLWGTILQNADLRNADLREAIFQDVLSQNANLQNANLRGAILWNITILQLRGLPSGEFTLYPTPDGWHLWVGGWQGTLEEIKTLVAEGEWPEDGDEEEIATHRALFESVYPLIDHHITKNADVIEKLAEKWNTESRGETK